MHQLVYYIYCNEVERIIITFEKLLHFKKKMTFHKLMPWYGADLHLKSFKQICKCKLCFCDDYPTRTTIGSVKLV